MPPIHPAGRALTSDSSVKSITMVVFLVMFGQNILIKTESLVNIYWAKLSSQNFQLEIIQTFLSLRMYFDIQPT